MSAAAALLSARMTARDAASGVAGARASGAMFQGARGLFTTLESVFGGEMGGLVMPSICVNDRRHVVIRMSGLPSAAGARGCHVALKKSNL